MGMTSTDYSASVGSTEYFFAAGSTTYSGQTTNANVEWTIDVENMAAGDRYEFSLYESVNGTRKRLCRIEVDGARDEHICFPARNLTDGYDLGAKKLAGSTDRTIKATMKTIT